MVDKYFIEVFESCPRQGPGSNKIIQNIYNSLSGLPQYPRILDVGCGKGGQTFELSRLTNGTITALDLRQSFIEFVREEAEKTGSSKKISAIVGDMNDMPFKAEEFDLIWSEGAMFIIGVEAGLSKWKHFLKTNGYLVFSECCWLKDSPPRELIDFFRKEYPDMKTASQNIEIADQNNFSVESHFTMPIYAWKENFYDPIEKKTRELLAGKYAENKEAQATLYAILKEIELFDKYNDYWGYEFFILRK